MNMIEPIIKSCMARLRALAAEAMEQYDTQIKGGGEPTYPAWVDDIRTLCGFVAQSVEARQDRSAA